jgi:acetolactate synthase-1/2/3 large subunit
MHFVSALDRVAGLRCVLGLAETVVAGCADGYARMAASRGDAVHCGPGLGNAIANLHNAKRALTPIVNIVGDQRPTTGRYDAPLTADTEGLARTCRRGCAPATARSRRRMTPPRDPGRAHAAGGTRR